MMSDLMRLDDLGDWRRTHFANDLTPALSGSEVVVMGWVGDIRDLGGLKFFTLHDVSGWVQVTAPKAKVGKEVLRKVDALTPQSSVAVKGKLVAMKQAPRGIEIIPDALKIFNIAVTPLPLDPYGRVRAELDTRLDSRFLDLRSPRSIAIFKIRNVAVQTIRDFLTSQGFIEVHTPKIVASATESGAALFPISYFDREAFLSQSPQLYKEILTGIFERVFEIGPIFRAEEHDTRRHLNEATSVDIEAAFMDEEDVMKVLESMVVKVFEAVENKCAGELEVLQHKLKKPKLPFPRISYTEALEMLEEAGVKLKWGEDFSTQAEKKLGELIGGAYFVIDWPTEIKPFYIIPKSERPEICRAFDLMYEDIELSSGGMRIHLEEMLVEQLKRKGLNPQNFESHLKNFRYGIPPHSGWGLGLDRLTMVLTNATNIREVVFFPRDRQRLTP